MFVCTKRKEEVASVDDNHGNGNEDTHVFNDSVWSSWSSVEKDGRNNERGKSKKKSGGMCASGSGIEGLLLVNEAACKHRHAEY